MSAPVSVILQWSENLSGDLVCFIFINLIKFIMKISREVS